MEQRILRNTKDYEKWKNFLREQYHTKQEIEFGFEGWKPNRYPCCVVWVVNYPNDYFELTFDFIYQFE